MVSPVVPRLLINLAALAAFLLETEMTLFQRKRIKEEIEGLEAAGETDADQLLDELKTSRWSMAIMLVIALIVIAALWRLF